MCGILGTINVPLGRQELDLLRHRGPDGEGMMDVDCGSHRVTLAHRRLAIVDLSENGAQPMSTRSGDHLIIFNGEIYNHEDIRPALAGGTFRGHSDTETLLRALEMFGIAAVQKLNGIFAFAYLDLARGKLFLVRDSFGVKPIYYSVQQGKMCFASEMAPLLTMVESAIDNVGLSTLLKLRFSPSPHTLYRDIRRLRPGHVLEVDLAAESLSWREFPFSNKRKSTPRSSLSFDEAVTEYGRLFEQAVSRQLMSDVEVGILLSGGVDSALVAASARRASDRPLKAFTVGFTDADAGDVDEIDAAAETAALLGLEHHTTKIGFGDFIDVLRRCVRIVEEPLATTSVVPMHFLSALAASHVKVVLSGQGADEMLGGYNRYQAELWHPFLPTLLARIGETAASALGIRNDTLLRGLRTLREAEDVSRFLAACEVFSDDEILRLTGIKNNASRQAVQYFYNDLHCDQLPTSVERVMTIDARLGLPDDLLLYTDKITMRESLECRVPFLDAELAAFIESLPYHYRVTLRNTKIIHKHYAQRTLPPTIINRPKRGFQSPTRQWFRNKDLLGEMLLDCRSRFSRYFNLREVEAVIDQHRRGFNRERQIFLLLSLYFCLDLED